jgi:hypothetical protein
LVSFYFEFFIEKTKVNSDDEDYDIFEEAGEKLKKQHKKSNLFYIPILS